MYIVFDVLFLSQDDILTVAPGVLTMLLDVIFGDEITFIF